MSSTYAKKFPVPHDLQAEMWSLAQEVLRAATHGELDVHNRAELLRFSHEHFLRVMEARRVEDIAQGDEDAGVLDVDDDVLEDRSAR